MKKLILAACVTAALLQAGAASAAPAFFVAFNTIVDDLNGLIR